MLLWFEPPLQVDFDLRPGLALDGPLADEVLAWAEARRLALAPVRRAATPRAYAMLGENTLSTTALNKDHPRIALLERRGYAKVDRYSVCYSRSLDTPISDCELPAGMRLRHATEQDIEERMDLHCDAWSNSTAPFNPRPGEEDWSWVRHKSRGSCAEASWSTTLARQHHEIDFDTQAREILRDQVKAAAV